MKLIHAVASSALVPTRVRVALLRSAGAQIGAGVAVASGVMVKSHDLSIGDGAFINHGAFLDNGPIRIGRNVFIGPGVRVLPNDHRPGPAGKRAGEKYHAPVTIGDGCWIGANAVILPGVTVAPGCVVGAGAVVTKDTAPDTLVAGVPAREVKALPVG